MPSRKGFSLGEILIALLILAILSVLLVGVIPASVFGLRAAGQRVTAAQIARNEVEKMRRDGLDRLTDHLLTATNVNGTFFFGTVMVGQARDSEGNLLDTRKAREVVIEVRWKGRGGHDNLYQCRSTLVRQL